MTSCIRSVSRACATARSKIAGSDSAFPIPISILHRWRVHKARRLSDLWKVKKTWRRHCDQPLPRSKKVMSRFSMSGSNRGYALGDDGRNDKKIRLRGKMSVTPHDRCTSARLRQAPTASLWSRTSPSVSRRRREPFSPSTTCRCPSRQGEFLSVIGPSGCGKSTLFNVVGGLQTEYEGNVTVGGETHQRPACFRRHGVSGRIHIPLAHRDRECRLPARDRRHAEGQAP